MSQSIKQKWQAVEKTLSKIEDVLIIFVLFATVLLASSQIILRNAFSSGLSWADPALKMLVLYITLIGSIIATRENKHLSIDVLSKFLPDNINHLVQKITNFFSATICSLLAYYSLQLLKLSKEFQDIAFADIPVWVLQIILPVGFLLMAIRFVINNFNPNIAPDANLAQIRNVYSEEITK